MHGITSWDGDARRVENFLPRMFAAAPPTLQQHQAQASTATCSFALQSSSPFVHGVEQIEGLLIAHDLAAVELTRRANRPGLDDIVVELVDRYHRGVSGFDSLIAEGSFGIWDEHRRQLVLWRDVAGTRPLYYAHRPGRWTAFSSDLRPLAALDEIPDHIDLEFARSKLEIGPSFRGPTRTIRQHVRKVPPASFVVIDGITVRTVRYWDPPEAGHSRRRNPEDYAEELADLLRLAVGARTKSHGSSVASHLSGGLDSSTIAALAAEALRPTTITGISWAPPYSSVEKLEKDERPLAESAAHHAGIDLVFTRVNPTDLVQVLTLDQSLVPNTTLEWERCALRTAGPRGVTTILSGWGGDELVAFNGRGYFASLTQRGRLIRLGRELVEQRRVAGHSLRGSVKGQVILPVTPNWLLRRLRPDMLPTRSLPNILKPDFRAALERVELLPYENLRVRPGVHRMQRALLASGHLQERTESWAAHGAEFGVVYSYPLLDRRIIEFSLSIPDHLFFRHGWKRWLFRRAAAGIVPDDVRWNTQKFDVAKDTETRRHASNTNQIYRQRLSDVRANPFLDVDRLWAGEYERQPVALGELPTNPAWTAFLGVSLP